MKDRLVALRKIWGKSQRVMAVDAGVSLNSWQRYEAGAPPSAEVLARLAQLGANPGWLLLGQEPLLQKDVVPPAAYDGALMRDVIVALEELLGEEGRILSPAKKAELIDLVYQLETAERAQGRAGLSGAKIIQLVRQVA
jgi:transcriptional regulator with XRE-family HTH domain